ncbi:MerR family transcriptional regulator [Streptomyces sp. NPDC048514]|uniref:MerR family transcriptional regulator n=1 Tax=Streptomyces sp. NPDC048514 TaxID=3365564 RepID=UPI003715D7C8
MNEQQVPATTRERPSGPALTTGALARRLGVSPTTLRSWDRRYGIGPARADGRHRRWAPQDVAALETMCRLTTAGVPPAEAARAAREGGWDTAQAAPEGARDMARPGMGPLAEPAVRGLDPAAGPPSQAGGGLPLGRAVRTECRGLARAAVRLDAPAVEDQLAAALAEYGVVTAWQEVMVPTLHAVGRKWASSGDRYVEVEHLLSWHVSTALRRHTPPAATAGGPPAPGPVLLACVPGEQHTLPLEALNAALTELRIPARMFAAAVPADALVAAVRRLGPAVVVLWAQARATASPALARQVGDIRWGLKGARTHPLVMLGGPGWAGRAFTGTVRPTSLAEALGVLAAGYGKAVQGG